jgi:glycosyltransferase involved in cell wall biosynthesis
LAASLHIAGIDPERNFSGGETQVLGLTCELLARGHRAELFCDPEGALWERASRHAIVCRPLAIRNSVDLAAALQLRSLLAKNRYDVVHFHTARAHALAPYAGALASVRVVTRRMDSSPNRLFAPYLYGRAVDGVIAISEGVAGAIAGRSRAAQHRLRVIYSGVDCGHFTPPTREIRQEARRHFGLQPDQIAIAAVGALVARKNHRGLIEALVSLREQTQLAGPHLPIQCLIAGEGPLATALGEVIAEAGLHDCVRLLGRVADPRQLFHAADLLAMPSLAEGLGVAALEAMACALPVVASAVGGLREVVTHNETGLLLEPGKVAAWSQALCELSRNHEVRRAMGAAARQRGVALFSMDIMARKTLDFYEALLKLKRQGMD